MREEDFVTVVAMICLVLGFCIGGCCEVRWTTARLEKTAIQHNAGQYNPTTGKFEWLDKSNGEKE